MTTRHCAVRREKPQEWPIFEGVDLPDEISVLSVELRRHPSEAISVAVAEASNVLASAITRPPGPTRFQLWLIAIGGSYRPSDRLASYYADRVGLWESIEGSGLVLPKRGRTEAKIQVDDRTFTLVGFLEVERAAIPAAVEVTRQENAVLIAGWAADPVADLMVLARTAAGNQTPVLMAAVDSIREHIFVVRGFGEFDDAVVGVEVFAADEVLDGMELRMLRNGNGC